MPTTPSYRFDDIPLDKLIVSDSNVRRREITADLGDLIHSIETFGLQQPIVVQPKGTKFEIVIGQRRYLAFKQLGKPTIPARILDEALDPFQAKVVSFSENMQRRDLSPRDKAEACKTMLERLHTVREVAAYLGTTEMTIRKWLGFAAVPEDLKTMVEAGDISVPAAVRLSQHISDQEKALNVARLMAEKNLTAPQKARVLAAVEEAPDRPVTAIFRRAEEAQHEKKIDVILPEKYASALDRASRRMRTSASDLARDAIIEWLDTNRY